MQLKRTAMITAVSVATALSSTATMAAPLTFTELFNPAEINDPKNVVASIMNRLWKNDIQEVFRLTSRCWRQVSASTLAKTGTRSM